MLALVEEDTLILPYPLAPPFEEAVRATARTLGLPSDWLNATVARNWSHRWPAGLPSNLLHDVEWRSYGGLEVGLAGRGVLIPLKLHALADRSRVRLDGSMRVVEVDLSPSDAQRHLNDLLALAPSEPELRRAAAWVSEQDPSPHFGAILRAVLDRMRDDRG